MKRGGASVLVGVIVISLLLANLVSASWLGSFWDKISGNIVDGEIDTMPCDNWYCVDHDNERDYTTKSYISFCDEINGVRNYTYLRDTCVNGTQAVESCSGVGCYIREGICVPTSTYGDSYVTYSRTDEQVCPDCSNGVCNDVYSCPHCYSRVLNRGYPEGVVESCSGKTCWMIDCDGQEHYCLNGCQRGVCQPSCPYCYSQYSLSLPLLAGVVESCSGKNCWMIPCDGQEHYCLNGCQGGICNDSSSTIPPSQNQTNETLQNQTDQNLQNQTNQETNTSESNESATSPTVSTSGGGSSSTASSGSSGGGGGSGGGAGTTTPTTISSAGVDEKAFKDESGASQPVALFDVENFKLIAPSGVAIESEVKLSRSTEGYIYAYTGENYVKIQVDPIDAIDKAKQSMKTESVKSIKIKNYKETIVYEIGADKEVKVLYLIGANINIKANIDVDKGEVLGIEKPWWSFLAKEI